MDVSRCRDGMGTYLGLFVPPVAEKWAQGFPSHPVVHGVSSVRKEDGNYE